MSVHALVLTLTRVEIRKLRGRALFWVEAGLLALLVLALYAALLAVLANPPADMPPEAVAEFRASLHWPQGLLAALAFGNGGELGGLFAVVLAAAVVAQEYSWRTVHLWLGRGVPRGAYLLAKVLGLALALGALALVPLLAGGLVTGLATWHDAGVLPWSEVPWARVFAGWLRVWLTLAPYAALTLLVAVVSRSTLAALGVGLGYNLLVENLAVEVLLLVSPQAARVARYLPGLAAKAVLLPLTEGLQVEMGMQRAANAVLLQPGPAAWLLLAYTALAVGLAWWVFRHQDLPG